MKKIALLVLTIVLLFSCTTSKEKEEPKQIGPNYKAAFDSYFKDNLKSILASEASLQYVDSISWTQEFYEINLASSIWINDSIEASPTALKLIDRLSNSMNYGIDKRYYPTNLLNDLVSQLEKEAMGSKKHEIAGQLELLLTHYYMQHGKHLNYGLISLTDSITEVPRKTFTLNMPEYLKESLEKDSLISRLDALQPIQKEYKNLQKGLEKFLKSSSLTTDHVNVINFRVDSLLADSLAKEALILHNYLNESDKDSLFLSALIKFQNEHGLRPDSLVGAKTAKALSLSPYEYFKRIQATLERWKWKNIWPEDYLYVNIPAYTLEVVRNREVTRKHKVVVGTLKNQTPELIDSLEYIIAYPYWNVPRKISINEILVKAKKDSTYLSRNNYDVMTYSREHIDVNSIDWSRANEDNFKYLIRQQGGSYNALGLVKFIFPNKHAIYLHDTPSKYYFSMETRAYSHGCVRVHKAMDLAAYLLEEDENRYTIDSVYKYIDKKKEKPIRLNKKIPVFIYYFTTTADDTGTVTFYDDVYGLDRKLINELIEVSE